MRYGVIEGDNGRKRPIFYVDAGDGCYFCLNKYKTKMGRPTGWNRHHGTSHLARILFERFNRQLRVTEVPHHTCNNRWCINVDHLEGWDETVHRQLHLKSMQVKKPPVPYFKEREI